MQQQSAGRNTEWIRRTAARLKRLYTAAIYDIMDEMDLPNQCLDLAIKPIEPRMRLAGPAFTVIGGPDPRPRSEWPRNPKLDNYAIFDSMYPGCVVIVAAAGERRAGHWGELLSTAAKARGATGVVVDGGTRDGDLLLQIEDWPVFARYLSPIESRLRYRIWDIETPVAVSGTLSSQVRVDPGDWLFGDMDGVIVIPTRVLEDVLGKAEEVKGIEDQVRDEIRRGVPVPNVYAKYGRL